MILGWFFPAWYLAGFTHTALTLLLKKWHSGAWGVVGRSGSHLYFLAGRPAMTKMSAYNPNRFRAGWRFPFWEVQQGPGQFPFPPHHRVASRDHSLTMSCPNCVHISRTLPKSSEHIWMSWVLVTIWLALLNRILRLWISFLLCVCVSHSLSLSILLLSSLAVKLCRRPECPSLERMQGHIARYPNFHVPHFFCRPCPKYII